MKYGGFILTFGNLLRLDMGKNLVTSGATRSRTSDPAQNLL